MQEDVIKIKYEQRVKSGYLDFYLQSCVPSDGKLLDCKKIEFVTEDKVDYLAEVQELLDRHRDEINEEIKVISRNRQVQTQQTPPAL